MPEKLQMDFLQNIPLLAGLSKADLKRVLKETHLETFAKGAYIVTEGEQGGRMFLIIDGLANVTIGEKKKNTLGPGDFFGEISLLDKGPRSATVTAETTVNALSLASWNFLALLKEHWTMTAAVLKSVASLVRDRDATTSQ